MHIPVTLDRLSRQELVVVTCCDQPGPRRVPQDGFRLPCIQLGARGVERIRSSTSWVRLLPHRFLRDGQEVLRRPPHQGHAAR